MMPEIFPLHVRGQGSSFSAGSNWAFNTLVVATFPIFLQNFWDLAHLCSLRTCLYLRSFVHNPLRPGDKMSLFGADRKACAFGESIPFTRKVYQDAASDKIDLSCSQIENLNRVPVSIESLYPMSAAEEVLKRLWTPPSFNDSF